MSALPARSTDPHTSHEAARHHIASGGRAAQQQMTVAAVEAYPGHTTLELSKRTGICRFVLARRASEVEEAGLIVRGQARRCNVSGRSSVTWHPPGKPEQRQLFGSAA